jgi:amino acid transporter
MFLQLKRILVGQPLATSRLHHERLSKRVALAVFSSDALSSVAYATEAILAILILAGALATGLSLWIAVGITFLLIIVGFSYRQTIHAYPNGGGAYIVAHENLGPVPGLVAAASLLIDYVLTVAVSISAGVAAITSAFPFLAPIRIEMALFFIALVTVLNLRGVKESGTIFAIPTYLFIGSLGLLLLTGLYYHLSGGLPALRAAVPPPVLAEHTEALTLFLILRAFAAGCTALTGVEAISNGVPAFRPPEAKNASITLIWMVSILGGMFLGITWLASLLGALPNEVTHETVVSQIGRALFGETPMYFVLQAATAMILILAANTAYADFPRLASLLAKDRYLPRQFASRGDRLVFSNGILVLGLFSALLVVGFRANEIALLPLYAVGVFLSFTLSQSGMIAHHLREREPAWRRGLLINGFGAILTLCVLLIIAVTKFTHGAWAVIVLIPFMVWAFQKVSQHYRDVARQLSLDNASIPPTPKRETAIVLVSGLHKGILPALQYARALAGENVTAVYVDLDPEATAKMRQRWEQWCCGVPLVVLDSPYRSLVEPIARYVQQVEARHKDDALTIVMPEFVPAYRWQYLLHNQTAVLIKMVLRFQLGKIITTVPYKLEK